jgi:hypothetical protein
LLTLTYSDADGNCPIIAEVTLDDSTTISLVPALNDFSDAVQFSALLPGSGWSNGTVRFSDNNSDFVTAQIHATANNDAVAVLRPSVSVWPNPCHLRQAGKMLFRLENNPATHSELTIYNIKGQVLHQAESVLQAKGDNSFTWNGCDKLGKKAAPGLYLATIQQGKQKSSRKFLILP